MKKNYNKDFEETGDDFIKQYIFKSECQDNGGDSYAYDCDNCLNKDYCLLLADTRCNHEYAESIDFGGYDSEDEFWEQLFD